MRTRPEDMGLLPDGDVAPPPGQGGCAAAAHRQEYSYRRGEAMRTPALRLLTAASAFGIFGVPGFQRTAGAHQPPAAARRAGGGHGQSRRRRRDATARLTAPSPSLPSGRAGATIATLTRLGEAEAWDSDQGALER